VTKIIKFTYPKGFSKFLEGVMPTPIKVNIPEWFKKLEHKHKNRTVKGCMPFLDSLTSGYLIRMTQDFYLNHNVLNPDTNKKDTYFQTSVDDRKTTDLLNVNTPDPQVHPVEQLKGSPLVEKNKNLPFYKILNPFKIITPPGYSVLILPPLNNKDDRFEIIPGIVDTDIYTTEINFPFVVNGDKYETLETIIERGTPLAQIIPFKREDWKMKVEEEKERVPYWYVNIPRLLLHNYKNFFWRKKKWN
jgi:hypothetical protein